MKLLTKIWKKRVPFGTHWEMLAVTVVLFVLVAVFVDLKPVVDENFFFSTSDPQFQQSKKIEQRFPSQPEVILAVSSRDISSSRYLGQLQHLPHHITTSELWREVRVLPPGARVLRALVPVRFWGRCVVRP